MNKVDHWTYGEQDILRWAFVTIKNYILSQSIDRGRNLIAGRYWLSCGLTIWLADSSFDCETIDHGGCRTKCRILINSDDWLAGQEYGKFRLRKPCKTNVQTEQLWSWPMGRSLQMKRIG